MRNQRFTVKMSQHELRLLKLLAHAEGESMSVVVRQAVKQAARTRGLTNKNEDAGKLAKATPTSSTPQSHKATAPSVGS